MHYANQTQTQVLLLCVAVFRKSHSHYYNPLSTVPSFTADFNSNVLPTQTLSAPNWTPNLKILLASIQDLWAQPGQTDILGWAFTKLGVYEDVHWISRHTQPLRVDAQVFADWGVDMLKFHGCNTDVSHAGRATW